LFKEKSRQLDEEASIEIEQHRSIQNSCKFYNRLNDVKRLFEAQVGMCRAKNVELLTKKDQVMSRRREHEGEERDQPPDQGDLRHDGVAPSQWKH
jgi:hypothetical protein